MYLSLLQVVKKRKDDEWQVVINYDKDDCGCNAQPRIFTMKSKEEPNIDEIKTEWERIRT